MQHLSLIDNTFSQLHSRTFNRSNRSSWAFAMGANSSKCSKSPAVPNDSRPPAVPAKDETGGSRQHPPTYEEATFGPPNSDQATQGTSELRRHDTQTSVASSMSEPPSEAAVIEMKKMTPYQKQAYRNQRKAEKKHAKAQRKADKAHRKAEKTEVKFTKRADKLTNKANVSAEKAHTKVMKAADKAHIKAVKKTAKAQKKAEIATARANAKARAAQATAQIASHRIGIKSSTPSITTPPIVMRSTSERSQSYSHSSPTAGPMRPRRVTTVESSTPSRPPSREPDTQRSHSYAGHMPQPSPTADVPPMPSHSLSAQHIPQSTSSAPQLPELFQSEKRQQSRCSELEDEYAQLEFDRIQLDREVVDRQISDLYAGIGKLQLDSRRNSE